MDIKRITVVFSWRMVHSAPLLAMMCATRRMEVLETTAYKRKSANVSTYNTSNIDPAWLPPQEGTEKFKEGYSRGQQFAGFARGKHGSPRKSFSLYVLKPLRSLPKPHKTCKVRLMAY
jgi:hypothetical protein